MDVAGEYPQPRCPAIPFGPGSRSQAVVWWLLVPSPAIVDVEEQRHSFPTLHVYRCRCGACLPWRLVTVLCLPICC